MFEYVASNLKFEILHKFKFLCADTYSRFSLAQSHNYTDFNLLAWSLILVLVLISHIKCDSVILLTHILCLAMPFSQPQTVHMAL